MILINRIVLIRAIQPYAIVISLTLQYKLYSILYSKIYKYNIA